MVGGSRNLKLSPNTCFGVSFHKPLPIYLTDIKLKMSAVFTFEIKGARKEKIFIFLKGCLSAMGDPMDVIFKVFSEAYVRLLKA